MKALRCWMHILLARLALGEETMWRTLFMNRFADWALDNAEWHQIRASALHEELTKEDRR